jgi:coatomer protein complex subunit epsilon
VVKFNLKRDQSGFETDEKMLIRIKKISLGSYSASHDAISSISNPSFQLVLFSARCSICLKRPAEAIKLLKEYHDAEPAARALTLLAQFYHKSPNSKAEIDKLGEAAEALIEEIADEENDGPDSVLRVTLATILILAENLSMAVFILKQGVQLKSLEAVAALISLYLSPRLRRPDLARSLYTSAKAWADDAILLQMAEAWIGATTGSAAGNSNGREPGGYQSAFYVFDEITNTAVSKPHQVNVVGLNGKAITQLAMGHVEEAHANLTEALKVVSLFP